MVLSADSQLSQPIGLGYYVVIEGTEPVADYMGQLTQINAQSLTLRNGQQSRTIRFDQIIGLHRISRWRVWASRAGERYWTLSQSVASHLPVDAAPTGSGFSPLVLADAPIRQPASSGLATDPKPVKPRQTIQVID